MNIVANANDILEILKHSLVNKRVGVFCGAGISLNSGLSLVNSVVEYFLQKLGCSEDHAEQFFFDR